MQRKEKGLNDDEDHNIDLWIKSFHSDMTLFRSCKIS